MKHASDGGSDTIVGSSLALYVAHAHKVNQAHLSPSTTCVPPDAKSSGAGWLARDGFAALAPGEETLHDRGLVQINRGQPPVTLKAGEVLSFRRDGHAGGRRQRCGAELANYIVEKGHASRDCQMTLPQPRSRSRGGGTIPPNECSTDSTTSSSDVDSVRNQDARRFRNAPWGGSYCPRCCCPLLSCMSHSSPGRTRASAAARLRKHASADAAQIHRGRGDHRSSRRSHHQGTD